MHLVSFRVSLGSASSLLGTINFNYFFIFQSQPASQGDKGSVYLSVGAIVGIVIGSLVIIAICGVGLTTSFVQIYYSFHSTRLILFARHLQLE